MVGQRLVPVEPRSGPLFVAAKSGPVGRFVGDSSLTGRTRVSKKCVVYRRYHAQVGLETVEEGAGGEGVLVTPVVDDVAG